MKNQKSKGKNCDCGGIFGLRFLTAVLFIILLLAACTGGKGSEVAQQKTPGAKPEEVAVKPPTQEVAAPLEEGSKTSDSEQKLIAKKLSEGSDSKTDGSDHPPIDDGKKVQREVKIPKDVEGKWKAVKILVRNKADEEKNEMKTVDLGASFTLADNSIKVTVGPFFPNFVMDGAAYTSMNNATLNPAVQLVVEENGKEIYKGWAFARFPTLYAFEHPKIGFQLMDFIPTAVS